jgi:hypothetical protein
VVVTLLLLLPYYHRTCICMDTQALYSPLLRPSLADNYVARNFSMSRKCLFSRQSRDTFSMSRSRLVSRWSVSRSRFVSRRSVSRSRLVSRQIVSWSHHCLLSVGICMTCRLLCIHIVLSKSCTGIQISSVHFIFGINVRFIRCIYRPVVEHEWR